MSDHTPTTYRRTGDRIHLPSCVFGYSKHSVWWTYAEGRSVSWIRDHIANVAPWLALCRRCVT